MPPSRAQLVSHIAELVGHDVLEITDAQVGWPALGTLLVDERAVPVSLFVSVVSTSGRGRDDRERRYQNPANKAPITLSPGRQPLLVGLWETDNFLDVPRPLLVSADPVRRAERVTRDEKLTRFSVFARRVTLLTAAETGWAEGVNSKGETIRCFFPPLLPLSASADWSGLALSDSTLQIALDAAGVPEASSADYPAAVDRARRTGTSIIRDARFSRRVTDAYEGLCAMCGLDLGLVQGAHIYPASAPGSVDEPWNGLALCANHHYAFDRHLVGVSPDSRRVVFQTVVHEQTEANPATRSLVDSTFATLAEPAHATARPPREMFDKRYQYFAELCDWITAS